MIILRYLDDNPYYTIYNTSLNKGGPFAMDTSPHFWIINTAIGSMKKPWMSDGSVE